MADKLSGLGRGRLALFGVALACLGAGLGLLFSGGDDQVADSGPRADLTAGGADRSAEPPTRNATPPADRPQTTGPDSNPPPAPPRIEIPAIAVSAHVAELGLNADKSLEVPENYSQAGWWKRGSVPGEKGPAIVVGHVDSKEGPGVFRRLGQLRSGDRVRYVDRNGTVARFVIQRTEQYDKDRFPTRRVYADTPHPTIRLITCTGSFDSESGHYVSNLIVFGTAA